MALNKMPVKKLALCIRCLLNRDSQRGDPAGHPKSQAADGCGLRDAANLTAGAPKFASLHSSRHG